MINFSFFEFSHLTPLKGLKDIIIKSLDIKGIIFVLLVLRMGFQVRLRKKRLLLWHKDGPELGYFIFLGQPLSSAG
jgi:hypothetical protein